MCLVSTPVVTGLPAAASVTAPAAVASIVRMTHPPLGFRLLIIPTATVMPASIGVCAGLFAGLRTCWGGRGGDSSRRWEISPVAESPPRPTARFQSPNQAPIPPSMTLPSANMIRDGPVPVLFSTKGSPSFGANSMMLRYADGEFPAAPAEVSRQVPIVHHSNSPAGHPPTPLRLVASDVDIARDAELSHAAEGHGLAPAAIQPRPTRCDRGSSCERCSKSGPILKRHA